MALRRSDRAVREHDELKAASFCFDLYIHFCSGRKLKSRTMILHRIPDIPPPELARVSLATGELCDAGVLI